MSIESMVFIESIVSAESNHWVLGDGSWALEIPLDPPFNKGGKYFLFDFNPTPNTQNPSPVWGAKPPPKKEKRAAIVEGDSRLTDARG